MSAPFKESSQNLHLTTSDCAALATPSCKESGKHVHLSWLIATSSAGRRKGRINIEQATSDLCLQPVADNSKTNEKLENINKKQKQNRPDSAEGQVS